MKISTKGRYGTRALLDIALHQGSRPIQLKEIAQRQQISPLYLERLITPLIAGGLVRSIRGAKGGIVLARTPQQIKLIDVMRLLEGPTNPVECVGNPDACTRSGRCVTRDVWNEIRQAVDNVLENITLQDLVERQRSREKNTELMYYI